MRQLIIVGLLALSFAPAALAQTSHGTHEHGMAELRVGVDGTTVLVEFCGQNGEFLQRLQAPLPF